MIDPSILINAVVGAVAVVGGGGGTYAILKYKAARNADDIKEVKNDLKEAVDQLRQEHTADIERITKDNDADHEVLHGRIDRVKGALDTHIVESVNINREIAALTETVSGLNARLDRFEDKFDRLIEAVSRKSRK